MQVQFYAIPEEPSEENLRRSRIVGDEEDHP